jgi:hypothetical protein
MITSRLGAAHVRPDRRVPGGAPQVTAAYGTAGVWLGANEVWTGSSFVTVLLGTDRRGYPAFGEDLATAPRSYETWLVGDSHVGAVIMELVRRRE